MRPPLPSAGGLVSARFFFHQIRTALLWPTHSGCWRYAGLDCWHLAHRSGCSRNQNSQRLAVQRVAVFERGRIEVLGPQWLLADWLRCDSCLSEICLQISDRLAQPPASFRVNERTGSIDLEGAVNRHRTRHGCYSSLRSVLGSTRTARTAGQAHAMTAVVAMTAAPAPRIAGSRGST